MKKLLCVLLLLLLTVSACFAVSVQVEPVETSVKPGETIIYNINVDNDMNYAKQVVFYMISDKLNQHSFTPSYKITVPANNEEVVVLKATLPASISAGRHYDSVYFEIDDVVQSSQTISYTVEGPEQHFSFNSITVPGQVDPREDFNVTLNFFSNYERVEKVYASVDVYEADGTSLYYSLEVLDVSEGNNSVIVPVSLDSKLSPVTASVRVNISWYDLSFGSKIEEFSIIGYAENTTEVTSSTSITALTNSIIIENNGTLVIQGFDYEVPVNSLDLYFVSSASTSYTLTSNSIIFHVPELYPGESVELTYELNYSILYLLPFLVIGIIYLIHYFTRSVVIKKEIFEFKKTHNLIGFKVVLNLTNVSKNKVNRIRVKEVLPPIISDVFDYGTLSGEVKKVGDTKFIEWNLGKLRPNEEVILSYKMRSKIGFIGELKLEPTIVEVLNAEGRVQSTVRTNTILIDITSKKKEPEKKIEKKEKKKSKKKAL